jgi:hypothetical protein
MNNGTNGGTDPRLMALESRVESLRADVRAAAERKTTTDQNLHASVLEVHRQTMSTHQRLVQVEDLAVKIAAALDRLTAEVRIANRKRGAQPAPTRRKARG